MSHELTPERRLRFLTMLSESGNVRLAARAAGLSRQALYRHREADPRFATAWQAALEEAVDVLQEAARQRAVIGVPKPVYYQGKLIGHVPHYSDALLMFLLRAHRPEIYRDRQAAAAEEPMEFLGFTGEADSAQ